MNSQIVWISFVVLLSAFVSTVEMAEAFNTAVSAANNDFTKDVYMNLAIKYKQNTIISPFSLHVVLGLTSFSAKGDTATAMMKGLRIKHSQTLLKDYKGVIEQLSETPELNIANKIFLGQSFHVNPTYAEKAKTYFSSEIDNVDFSKKEVAAKHMNDWVENKTNNKIKDLIKSYSLDNLTKVVLINAVHFKGKWSYQFDKSKTTDAPFYINATDSVNIPMMHMKQNLYMYEEEGDHGFKMLELPYGNVSTINQLFSMHIFLPNRRDGLEDLEKRLFDHDESFAEEFGNIVKATRKQDVEVSFPRFKIESEWNMNQLVKDMGMEIIFTEKADFSGMNAGNNSDRLTVSKIIQKAFIEVDEEGTEAAASSAVRICKRSLTYYDAFEADHPFLIMILFERKHILFVSKVVNFVDSTSANTEDVPMEYGESPKKVQKTEL